MKLHRQQGGAPLRLGKELGRGGEGAVFEVQGNPNLVAKIYTKPPTPQKVEKLAAMARAASPELLRVAAWPIDVLLDERRQVRGFIMPKVASREDLHELYSPKSRATTFPKADFRFVVRAAANLARAFGFVHARGHVIGDVNHGNALVGNDGTIMLIDCDSFQIRDRVKTHTCDVGVQLFTAPELQGKNFRGLRRSVNHDGFGLAVLLFHLLFQGRHPFAGRYRAGEMTIERAITERRFAYGSNCDALDMSPPPGTLPLDAFGPTIAGLFDSAFASTPGERPSATAWVAALQALEDSLIACERTSTHFQVGKTCCWCDLERQTGIRLFGQRIALAGRATLANLDAIWQSIIEIPHPGQGNLPRLDNDPATPHQQALSLVERGKRFLNRAAAALGAMSLVYLFAERPSLGALGVLAGSVLTWILSRPSKDVKDREQLALRAASTAWETILQRWNTECSSDKYDELLRRLSEVKWELATLAHRCKQEIEQLTGSREQRIQAKRRQFLSGFRLDELTSQHITRMQQAKLSAYGINTAADIDRDQTVLASIVSPRAAEELIAWYRMHLRTYEGPPEPEVDPAEIAAIQRRYDHLQEQLAQQLADGPERLRKQHREITDARLRLQWPIKRAWRDLSKARRLSE